VGNALAYIDHLVARVPGTVDIDPRNLASDPRLRAIFASEEDLRASCRRSWELRDYARTHDADDYWVLICMHQEEQPLARNPGDARSPWLEGFRSGVHFCDHRINNPGPTEADARRGLQDCIFQSLLVTAEDHASLCRKLVERLQKAYQPVHTRLCEEMAHVDEIEPDPVHRPAQPRELRRRMREISLRVGTAAEKLQWRGCSTPQAWVDNLNEVLGHPENYVRLRKIKIPLNRCTGLSQAGPDSRLGKIELAEMKVANQSPRVVVLARVPQSLIPESAGATQDVGLGPCVIQAPVSH
jgi:hypothetical protein